DLVPRDAERLAVGLDVRAALVGELEGAPSGGLVAVDEPLVLELRERGVDRARAGAPDAAAALLELLHELVAVARLLLEQEQDRRAEVAAARPLAAPAGPERAEAAGAEGDGPEPA